MAATTLPGAGISFSGTVSVKSSRLTAPHQVRLLLPRGGGRRVVLVASASPPTPPNISEKVAESIKNAEETCAEDATSGECAAAWDEVEELSAAASHARDKLKDSDPLEKYCKDNPETDECRTYED
ncbi:hypothetical protein Cni_G12748 [Canna indica]|uniref:CP12 domain-containing protein n=1 Tax=Canna indica TaxID=4628 RepID=A0AAQ3K8D2_9LILI|nr:hypothetical protein Cni_G12748 [Canna indica]